MARPALGSRAAGSVAASSSPVQGCSDGTCKAPNTGDQPPMNAGERSVRSPPPHHHGWKPCASAPLECCPCRVDKSVRAVNRTGFTHTASSPMAPRSLCARSATPCGGLDSPSNLPGRSSSMTSLQPDSGFRATHGPREFGPTSSSPVPVPMTPTADHLRHRPGAYPCRSRETAQPDGVSGHRQAARRPERCVATVPHPCQIMRGITGNEGVRRGHGLWARCPVAVQVRPGIALPLL